MSRGRFSNLEYDNVDKNAEPALEEYVPEWARNGAVSIRQTPINAIRDADFYLEQARVHELSGDMESAMQSCSAALGEDPMRLDAWLGQLWLLCELEEFREADMWAGKALSQFPDNASILATRAVARYRMGFKGEARDLSDTALEGRHESDTVWLCRADVMLDNSQIAAEQCFIHAKRVSRTPGLTQLRLAGICIRHGCWRLAMEQLQELVLRESKAARAWYLLGVAQQRLGMVKQAQASLETAAQLAPANRLYAKTVKDAGVGLGEKILLFLRRILSP